MSDGSTSSDRNKARFVPGRTRIRDAAGYRGTVVYVGQVASSRVLEAPYAGIVWDDVTRGKHDGTVVCCRTGQLVRHFAAPSHPTAASFVKLHKVDTGVTLNHTLLQQKYVPVHSNECVAPDNLLPHTAQTASGRNDKPIELLGELNIRQRQQLDDLSTVSLRYQGISSIPADDSLRQRLPHILEIDLAGNLLSDWSDVWNLLDSFPTLRKLNVASNHIGDWQLSQSQLPPQQNQQQHCPRRHHHGQLQHLNLNGTRLQSMHTVLAVGRSLPALRELVLTNNNSNLETNNHNNTHHQSAVARMSHSMEESPGHPNSNNNDNDSSTSSSNNERVDDDDREQKVRQGRRKSISDLATQLADVFANLVFVDCSNCTGLLQSTDGDDDDEPNALVTLWSKLPNLQALSLDDNSDLTAFRPTTTTTTSSRSSSSGEGETNGPTEDDNIVPVFYPALQRLQLAGTNVAHWSDLSALNDLSRLTSLRLRHCPLTAVLSPAVARTHVIAHFPTLTVLNATPITATERREAARQCVSGRLDPPTWTTTTAKQQSELPTLQHAQHAYWIAQYPELAATAARNSPTAAADGGGGCFSSDDHKNNFCVVNVIIRSLAAASCTQTALVRRLPTQLTIGRLKALCARQFGLDMDLQTLHFCRTSGDIPEVMDGSDEYTLHDYNVPDGAEIFMNEMELEAEARKQQLAALQLEERVNQQERELHDFRERQKRVNQ